MTRYRHALLLLHLALLGAGCATGHDRRGFLPFYEEGTAQGERTWSVRPLWHHREVPRAELSESHFLWPVGLARREGRESLLRVLPLFQRTVRVDHLGYEDRDFFVFPVWFQGWSIDEGNYFAIFPVGGTLKGYLGKDTIDFWAFPAYARLVDAEQVSTHYAWPLVNVVGGEGWDGFRVFPFFGRYRHSDVDGRPAFDRRFYLWPFVHVHENNLNSAHPSRTLFVFPFYGAIDSENATRRTWLFPLFKYEEDRTRKRAELRCPFPIAVFGWSLDPVTEPYVKRDFWPLFGYRTTERYHRHFVLSPLERLERYDDGRHLNERRWVLPLWWDYRRLDRTTGVGRREWRLFPLVRYRRGEDGTVRVSALALEWFRDPQGFEQMWAPLWQLYTHHRDGPSGRTWTQALWGVYRGWQDPGDGSRGTSLLGGAWERTRDPEGRRRTRWLWFFGARD
ncbi:MAG: hypothetical protein HY722_02770 [Planctomycetes bacterium]|nr:hypothetical protein [Planctomycetota bacterium]